MLSRKPTYHSRRHRKSDRSWRAATAAPGGTSEIERIKFVVVWKRLDGKGLLHRDIWNADQ
jgi:hypothetical protein